MRPDFRVLADNIDITAKIRDRLLDLTITDEAGMESDKVEIRLDDRDHKLALPATGATLDIAIGWEKNLLQVGLYKVDELRLDGQTMAITAKAADFKGPMRTPKTRPWHSTTLGAIIETIAGENGYNAAVSQEFASEAIAHLDQTEESDLNLLTRLAKDRGAVSKPIGKKLVFVASGEAKAVTGTALASVTLTRKDCLGFPSVTLKDRGKFSAVTAAYHDHNAAKREEITVGSGEAFTIRKAFEDAKKAKAAASAKLKSLKRGTGELSANITGNPAVQAEGQLTFTGFRDGIDGSWSVKTATHTLTSTGYTTSVSCEYPSG